MGDEAARDAWRHALEILEQLDDRYAKRVRAQLDKLDAWPHSEPSAPIASA